MKFKRLIQRKSKPQTFDLHRMIRKGGKTYCVYDAIQEARKDVEIYQTLEKYGSLDKIKMDPNKVFADFTQFGTLADMKNQQIKANQMWSDLPFEVRKIFNNDVHTFLREGKGWIEKRIKKETQPEQPTVKPEQTTTQTTQQGVNKDVA